MYFWQAGIEVSQSHRYRHVQRSQARAYPRRIGGTSPSVQEGPPEPFSERVAKGIRFRLHRGGSPSDHITRPKKGMEVDQIRTERFRYKQASVPAATRFVLTRLGEAFLPAETQRRAEWVPYYNSKGTMAHGGSSLTLLRNLRLPSRNITSMSKNDSPWYEYSRSNGRCWKTTASPSVLTTPPSLGLIGSRTSEGKSPGGP
jgi:hypothetical protein